MCPTDAVALKCAERIARQLERAIIDRVYRDRLPAERQLASQLQVSRACLREALSLLAARGLISREQGRGTRIHPLGERKMAELWGELAQRHPHLQLDLLDFRLMLECRIAELAALQHTAEDRERLLRVGERVERAYAAGDRAEQIACDVAFHQALADASHNLLYGQLMGSLLRVLHEHVQLSLAGIDAGGETARELREQHRALLSAVLERRAAAASAAARRHLDYVCIRLNQLAMVPGGAARSQ